MSKGPAPPGLSPLSLPDALPIWGMATPTRHPDGYGRARLRVGGVTFDPPPGGRRPTNDARQREASDRKSTRLNSSHANISSAALCLEKKTRVVREREGAASRRAPSAHDGRVVSAQAARASCRRVRRPPGSPPFPCPTLFRSGEWPRRPDILTVTGGRGSGPAA